jgi:hypothetical protein
MHDGVNSVRTERRIERRRIPNVSSTKGLQCTNSRCPNVTLSNTIPSYPAASRALAQWLLN